jgi:hypothetical protein
METTKKKKDLNRKQQVLAGCEEIGATFSAKVKWHTYHGKTVWQVL